MNISEANDLNAAFRYLLGLVKPDSDELDHEQARQAAARLADRARKALSAGINGDDVTAAWPGKPR